MKKITFNDRYGLTQAVLDGTKSMTRRIVPEGTLRMAQMEVRINGGELAERINDHSFYLWHEEVAVSQRYKDCWDIYQQRWEAKNAPSDWHTPDAILGDQVELTPGWKNKMFVKADLMPHRIRITDIRVERLQDISEEDCLREGVEKWIDCYIVSGIMENHGKNNVCFDTPREAFAALIDRISGRGTWQRNPWVFVYGFRKEE